MIQIGVQELTSVRATDPDRLHNYVDELRSRAGSVDRVEQNLIINSSNPKLIGAAYGKQTEWLTPEQLKHPRQSW